MWPAIVSVRLEARAWPAIVCEVSARLASELPAIV